VIGRRVLKKTEGIELQEFQSAYKVLFDTEKIDIERKNRWFKVFDYSFPGR